MSRDKGAIPRTTPSARLQQRRDDDDDDGDSDEDYPGASLAARIGPAAPRRGQRDQPGASHWTAEAGEEYEDASWADAHLTDATRPQFETAVRIASDRQPREELLQWFADILTQNQKEVECYLLDCRKAAIRGERPPDIPPSLRLTALVQGESDTAEDPTQLSTGHIGTESRSASRGSSARGIERTASRARVSAAVAALEQAGNTTELGEVEVDTPTADDPIPTERLRLEDLIGYRIPYEEADLPATWRIAAGQIGHAVLRRWATREDPNQALPEELLSTVWRQVDAALLEMAQR